MKARSELLEFGMIDLFTPSLPISLTMRLLSSAMNCVLVMEENLRRSRSGLSGRAMTLSIGQGRFTCCKTCRKTGLQQIAPGRRFPIQHLPSEKNACMMSRHQLRIKRFTLDAACR